MRGISRWSTRFARSPSSTRARKRAIREEIGKDRSWAIVSSAETTATLAVRERDRGRLVYGLVGLSLFTHEDFDARDPLVEAKTRST
jgi:hypothetical protein